MSSIINAGTSGVTITGSTSTVLSLATNGTTRLNIDASGNLAVGTGNLTFSSTAQRITGDMANATLTNRLAFQNSVTNANTPVNAIPNGTATGAGFRGYGASDPTNAPSVSVFQIGTTDSRIASEINGTASYTPMTFYTGGSERMRIDSSGNVGIGGAAGTGEKVTVTGTLPLVSGFSFGYLNLGTIPSGATTLAVGYFSRINPAAASFTLTNLRHFMADQSTFGAGSTVTNQFGFYAESSLTGGTNNYGFYSAIASGSNRWNFYAAGTARNYFAGRTDVGNTRISEANVWNGVSIDSTSTVTLTSGSSVNLSSSVCGGAIISVYVTGSGNGGLFWANYSATVTKLVGNGEATDTGSDFAVYKNAASHTTTLKNKSASTQTFAVSILSGTLS